MPKKKVLRHGTHYCAGKKNIELVVYLLASPLLPPLVETYFPGAIQREKCAVLSAND